MKFPNLIQLILGAGGITLTSLSLVTPAQALTFNAANDFSTTNNPNGVWQYGYSSKSFPVGANFTIYPDAGTAPVLSSSGVVNYPLWFDLNKSLGYSGNVARNPKNIPLINGTVAVQPHELSFHPGPNGEYSIVRWTAPTTAIYNIAGTFRGLDFGNDDPTLGPTSPGTTTDVYALLNGTSFFQAPIIGYYGRKDPLSVQSFTQTRSLKAGDIIDFALGDGGNAFGFDTTGIDVNISSVSNIQAGPVALGDPVSASSIPESSPIVGIFVIGALGSASLLKKKK